MINMKSKIKLLSVIMFVLSVFAVFYTADAESLRYNGIVIGAEERRFTLSGRIESDFVDNTLSIAVTDKQSGEFVYLSSFPCMTDGSFVHSFELLPEAPAGVYNLSIGAYGKSEKLYETDLYFDPDPQESQTSLFSWCDKSDTNTMSPENCTFYIYLKDGFDNASAKFRIDGGAEYIQELAGEYTYINIPDIVMGNHTIDIKVEQADGETTSYTSDFTVMRKYTPQFMDEFNNRGVVTHYAHDTMLDIDADFMAAAGIKTIREGIKWSVIETPDGYTWDKTDKWVNQINDHDMNMTAIFGFNNYRVYTMYNHYNGEKVEDSNYIPRKQKNIEDYNNYVRNVLERYPNLNKFELWNEPNADTGLAAVDYTDLLMNTSVYVKEKDRFADISALSLFGFREMEWTQENFTAGMYPYMTAIAFHPYVQGAPDTGSQEERYEEMYQMIADNGGWKNMNITENGWSTFEYGVTEENAAANLVKQNVLSERYDLIGSYWYDLIDDGTDISNREHFFGIISNDRKPKPAYLAYAQLNERLAGSIYMGEVKEGEARIFVYAKDGQPTLLAWVPEGNAEIYVEGNISAEDIYGNKLYLFGNKISLDNSPVYIYGAGEDWLKKAAANEISRDADNWLIKYSSLLPDIAEKAEALFSADIKNLDYPELKNLLDRYNALGFDIISAGKSGDITNMQTSSALYELYRVMRMVNRLYIVGYNGGTITELETDFNDALSYSNDLYYNDGYIMQYSEELLRYAHNYYEKADKILKSGDDNPMKNGVLSGWDIMSDILTDWFYEFSSFEESLCYGLLMNIELTNNTYIDVSEAGTQKDMVVYLANKSKDDFSGKLEIYDESGNCLFVSRELSVATDQYRYVETSFLTEKPQEKDTAVYTLVLTDTDGNIVAKRNHEVKIYSKEAGSGYPSHEGKGNYGTDNFPINEDMSARAEESSDEDRIFEVDGKRFVLLDKDEDGNFFVAADDHYGQRGFNLVPQSQENTDMLRETGTWKYDPETETNIAYWLNHEFLENGNTNSGVNYKLPKAITDNLVEKEWDVEYAQDADVPDSYKVKSKIALMSATEWDYYSDRLGYTPYKAPYAYPVNGKNTYIDENGARVNTGWWLRTAFNQEESGNLIYGSYITVYRYNTQPGLVAAWSVRSSAQTKYIRPIFWLNSDFFAKNKIDIESAGIYVKEELAKADLTELLNIYTAEELLNLNRFLIGVSKDKTKVKIISPQAADLQITASSYDENERLVGIETNSIEVWEGFGEYPITLPQAADSNKLFIWEGLDKMKPVVEAREYTQSNNI